MLPLILLFVIIAANTADADAVAIFFNLFYYTKYARVFQSPLLKYFSPISYRFVIYQYGKVYVQKAHLLHTRSHTHTHTENSADSREEFFEDKYFIRISKYELTHSR